MEKVSHFTPFSIVPILKSYRVLHVSSGPLGIFPCSTSTTDWLRTSWSDDIENSIALISLLNIFRIICSFLLPRSGGHHLRQDQAGLASLHFAQNYPSSVSNALQSWCRALRAFYQRSLLLLCNVFCHVCERSLKQLEIDNISSVSTHEPKSSDKFFHFHLQMDVMFPNKFVAAIIGSSFLVS